MTRHYRPWRVAVIGCGGAAFGIHLPVLAAHHGFEVTVVCDRDLQRASLAADRFAVQHATTDITAFLDDVDLVAVLTGNHETLVEQALNARVNVVCEKPLSLDITQSRRLTGLAADSGTLLHIGAIRAHDPALHAAVTALDGETVTGGWLVKTDGADALARARFLPADAALYTFDQDADPLMPAGLSGQQRVALQTLLWQGYHQLTALCASTLDLTPIACTAVGETVHCVLTSTTGAVFTTLVGPAPEGVYRDEMVMTTRHRQVQVGFGPPYGTHNTTSVTLHDTSRESGRVLSARYATPCTALWDAINSRLHGQAPPDGVDSTAFALRVEELAAELVALVPHTPTDHVHAITSTRRTQ